MTTMQIIRPSAFSVCGSNGLMVTSNYLTLTRRYFITDITTVDSLNDLKGNDSNIDLKGNDSYIDLKRSDSNSELNLGLLNADILSVESMLSRNVVVYDFDITSVKSVAGKEGRKYLVIRETLLDYSKLFEELSGDPSSVGLKLKFYVMRLKLDTFLVEGLLRDFLKRCRLHMKMLAKTNCSLYYMEQSRLLLSEIAKFQSKQSRVFKHIDDAILHYRSSSDGQIVASYGLFASAI